MRCLTQEIFPTAVGTNYPSCIASQILSLGVVVDFVVFAHDVNSNRKTKENRLEDFWTCEICCVVMYT